MTRTPEERIRRADEFKRLWTEYGFDEVVETYRTRLIADFVGSERSEQMKREDIHRQLQMLGFFKQNLIQILTDGAAAKIDLKGKPRD